MSSDKEKLEENKIIENGSSKIGQDNIFFKNKLISSSYTKQNVDIIYDFGNAMRENIPNLSRDSRYEIIADCKRMKAKLEEVLKFLSPTDVEYEKVDDLVDELKTTMTLIKHTSQNELIEEMDVLRIINEYSKVRNAYETLTKGKGWC